MRQRAKSLLRLISVLMAAALLTASLPCDALATGFKAVTSVATRVYENSNGKGASKKVKKGTSLYVLRTKGGIAMVIKGDSIGYVKRKNLKAVSNKSSKKSTKKSSKKKSSSGKMTSAQLKKIKKLLEAQEKKNKKKNPSFKDAYKSGKYSNEQLCYMFLTKVMGYNTAAAAGVLANINYESGFRTSCVGDGGTSIGICQWHAGRKTRLVNYCKEHGYSSTSLMGQLAYLKYDLEHNYTRVNSYLKDVSNNAQGAYDAAYYFCYNFEAPASRVSQSTKRGQSAQKTYYPRYAKA